MDEWLAAAARLRERYDQYVATHVGQVSAVENALRSASYFIPGAPPLVDPPLYRPTT